MTNDKDIQPDVREESFRKETTNKEHQKIKEEMDPKTHRSLMGAPTDPNSPTTKGNFPPGLAPEDAADPGRATPDAPPVDNRSGSKE